MSAVILPRLAGEAWFGGCVNDGSAMPFADGFVRDLGDQLQNQVVPLLLSTRGRWLWCDHPFRVHIAADRIVIDGQGDATVVQGQAEGGLRGAALAAAAQVAPPSGAMPDPRLFTAPQYNTWIELLYDQNERDVRRYAEAILAHGWPPGVLMIDDTWQEDYGCWDFHPGRFRDPAGMVAHLHALGFAVMLWVCPMISPDSAAYRHLADQGLLLRGHDGRPAIRPWWNGHSALLDMTHPGAIAWMDERLRRLQRDYGIDGFKFDAGDFASYRSDDLAHVPGHPGTHSAAWARFGLRWPLNEYRACWGLGGQALAQRLCDKLHAWDETGIAGCIPNLLAQGLLGLPFGCPDMVGGGEYRHFTANAGSLDQELFVRHAQLSALMPMIQFSAAPWRVLDPRHHGLCREMAVLHAEHGAQILALARHAAATGEPIVRHLAWAWPGQPVAGIRDQFLLGDQLMVAPATARGQRSRQVWIPPGAWRDELGDVRQGPAWHEVPVPLERLPRFAPADRR